MVPECLALSKTGEKKSYRQKQGGKKAKPNRRTKILTAKIINGVFKMKHLHVKRVQKRNMSRGRWDLRGWVLIFFSFFLFHFFFFSIHA